MASLNYNSALDDAARAFFGSGAFKVMLVGASYAEDKDAHTKRSDITNEITGTGYTAGGQVVVPTITKDLANDRVDVVFPQVTWPTSTLVARKAVYYKALGGAATADPLIFVNDFGADVSTTAGTFTLAASTMRLANS